MKTFKSNNTIIEDCENDLLLMNADSNSYYFQDNMVLYPHEIEI